ncbi:protein TonB [Sphingobium sp. B11D3B]|nr:protein TonB [Sphingobium sp. B11D3B]
MFDMSDDDEPATQMSRPGVPAVHDSELWRPATRYADQPMSLQSRLFGMGGTAMVALLIVAGALFTWTTYQAIQKPASMNTFDVAPPAAPPEPVREIPPAPEEAEAKDMPDVERAKVEPAEIPVPSLNPLPVPAVKPAPDPGPLARDRTAPETQPAPPAPQVSNAEPTWQGLVLGALNKVKRYPREAALRRQQGVPYIRFVMNREGAVLSVRLERSSGVRALDNEALALPKRAAPLPKPPKEVAGDTLELVVPVEFFMR